MSIEQAKEIILQLTCSEIVHIVDIVDAIGVAQRTLGLTNLKASDALTLVEWAREDKQ